MKRCGIWTSSAIVISANLLTGPAYAYSAAEDAAAQEEQVKEAYERGYKAAVEEMKEKAAAAKSRQPSSVADTAHAAQPPAVKPSAIMDIKEVFSDAGHVETVQAIPITTRPLQEQPGASAPASTNAPSTATRTLAAAAPRPAARPSMSEQAPEQDQQPAANGTARNPDSEGEFASRRPAEQQAAQGASSEDEDADDGDGSDDADSPRYPTASRQYASPPATYAPRYASAQTSRDGYDPYAAYSAPREYRYGTPMPPPPSVSQYAPPPPGGRRMYWSPEYGRWFYY
jgi:hypothetical protein